MTVETQENFEQLPSHVRNAIQAAADMATTSVYNVDWQPFLDLPAPTEPDDFWTQRRRYDNAVAERRLAEPIQIPTMPSETEMVHEARAFGLPLENIRRGHQTRIDAAQQAESERAAALAKKQESERLETERANLKQLIQDGATLALIGLADDESKPNEIRIAAKAAVMDVFPWWWDNR